MEMYQPAAQFSGQTDRQQRFCRSRHGGRMYAPGAATLGGPHAVVDSLHRQSASHIHNINGWRSFRQWCKWVANSPP
ncbi:MAG: hypothetical protein ACK4QL_08800 [Pseudanabaenaceae cyanobacterium]